jgi:hypothetical protein
MTVLRAPVFQKCSGNHEKKNCHGLWPLEKYLNPQLLELEAGIIIIKSQCK